MLRLLRQEFVVEAAAVADAVARRVKGQPGHQDQSVGIVSLRTVCQRFRNAAVPGGDVLQTGEPDETHGVSKHLGHGNPLAAVQGGLEELQGTYFLIIRQIAIDRLGSFIEGEARAFRVSSRLQASIWAGVMAAFWRRILERNAFLSTDNPPVTFFLSLLYRKRRIRQSKRKYRPGRVCAK